MTLDDAIVAFGQVASDDFDSLEFDVRDYERLVMWLTELKLARESVFSDIGLAARATSENHQLKSENAKLRNDLEDANNQAEEVCIENAKLRELCEKLYGYYVSGTLVPCDFCDRYDCEGNAPTTCKADEYDPDGMVVEEIEERMRELGVDV